MWLLQLILALIQPKKPNIIVVPVQPSKPKPTTIPTPPVPVPTMPKYLWDTKEHIRHSIRVICDEVNMPLDLKNKICATIYGESEFDLHARNYNYKTNADGTIYRDENGHKVLLSTDHGLCQWNDKYHGHEITDGEAENNPEKAVRLMAKYWMMGELYRRWWIAYKNGRYKQFLTLTQHPMA